MEIIDKIKGMFVDAEGHFKAATAVGVVIGAVAGNIIFPGAGVLAIAGGAALGAFAGNTIAERQAAGSVPETQVPAVPPRGGNAGQSVDPVPPNLPGGPGGNRSR